MKRIIIVVLLLLWTSAAWAVESVVNSIASYPNRGLIVMEWDVTTAAGGTIVNDTTSAAITNAIRGYYVVLVVTNPGATAPTDDYDLTILDAQGVDIMGGKLADRDETNTEQVVPEINSTAVPRVVDGALTLTCASAGNTKDFEVFVYLKR